MASGPKHNFFNTNMEYTLAKNSKHKIQQQGKMGAVPNFEKMSKDK